MKRELMMTDERLAELLAACNPARTNPLGQPLTEGMLMERVSEVWRKLGEEMGFEFGSARAVGGKPPQYFIAEVTDMKKAKQFLVRPEYDH